MYFRPEYGRAASIADGGEWLDVEAHGGAWRVPLILRSLAEGELDAITPTFSGVYASTSLSPEQVDEAWSTTVERLRRLGLISVVVRGSPFVSQASNVPGLRPISRGRPTVMLDLTDETAAWEGLKKGCRSTIRQALRNGLTAEVRPAALADLLPGGDFRRLYGSTMERRGADALYTFDDAYYVALLNGLGPDLLVAEVHDREGAAVASSLLMRHDSRLHYHLAGSLIGGSGTGSNNLMLWSAIQFAVEQGLNQFHLGAGAAGRDSIFRFKSSFGGRELHYDVSGLIVDDEAYQQKVRDIARRHDVPVDVLHDSGFFPAYRAGASA